MDPAGTHGQTVDNTRIDGRDHPDENRRPHLRITVDGEEINLLPTDTVSFNQGGGYRRETPFTVSIDWTGSSITKNSRITSLLKLKKRFSKRAETLKDFWLSE
jgi:hypothetical protein